MKFGRFEGSGFSEPRWGIVDEEPGTVRLIDEPFSDWAAKVSSGQAESLSLDSSELELASLNVLAPYEYPAHVFNCGANFWSHLLATGYFKEPPPVPVACFKADTGIIGPGDEIRYPSYTNKLDYEIELVAVVGRPLRKGEQPSSCLLGYTIGNDISVRDTEDPFGTAPDLYTMKGGDAITPLGPWIITPEELGPIGEPAVDMVLTVNGDVRQHDNTGNFIFSMDYSLDWLNERNLLRAGDVIFTGTPAGPVGEDRNASPSDFLQQGDVIEATIERIGVLRNTVGAKEKPRGNSLRPTHMTKA